VRAFGDWVMLLCYKWSVGFVDEGPIESVLDSLFVLVVLAVWIIDLGGFWFMLAIAKSVYGVILGRPVSMGFGFVDFFLELSFISFVYLKV
jgi:hypothetical protein